MAERARYHTKFVELLSDLTPLEKLDAAKEVAATMQTPGWHLLEQLLERRQVKSLDALVNHQPARDAAEYAAALAEVRGIRIALDAGPTVLHLAERARAELSEQEGAIA